MGPPKVIGNVDITTDALLDRYKNEKREPVLSFISFGSLLLFHIVLGATYPNTSRQTR
jgi:hypothetical protein